MFVPIQNLTCKCNGDLYIYRLKLDESSGEPDIEENVTGPQTDDVTAEQNRDKEKRGVEDHVTSPQNDDLTPEQNDDVTPEQNGEEEMQAPVDFVEEQKRDKAQSDAEMMENKEVDETLKEQVTQPHDTEEDGKESDEHPESGQER